MSSVSLQSQVPSVSRADRVRHSSFTDAARCRRAELRQQPEHSAVGGADVATPGSVPAANDEPVVGYADVLSLDDRPPGAVPGVFLCVGAREQVSAYMGVEAVGRR